MTYRHLQRRIANAEQSLPAALKKREALREQFIWRAKQTMMYPREAAPRHATAVAALVLAGEPKIEEPLRAAWARVLTHYGVIESLRELRGQPRPAMEHLLTHEAPLEAAKLIDPLIMTGTSTARRLSEIFCNAPPWLLKYTCVDLDAYFLKFEVPDLSAAPGFGSIGLEDALRWPRLPLETMTAGDPVPEERSVQELKSMKGFARFTADPRQVCDFLDAYERIAAMKRPGLNLPSLRELMARKPPGE